MILQIPESKVNCEPNVYVQALLFVYDHLQNIYITYKMEESLKKAQR